MRSSLLIFASILSLILLLAPPVFAVPPAPVNDDDLIAPLPRGCIRVSPPGQPDSPCCINGKVYLDGEPVVGAEVIIRNENGDQIARTSTRTNAFDEPTYEILLPASTRNQTIRITVRYQGRETTVFHTVFDGSQQVDIVLPRNYAIDYVRQRDFAIPSTVTTVTALAVMPNGNVIIAGRTSQPAATIVQLDPDGTLRRAWALPSELTEPIDLAMNGTTVYVLDAGSKQVFLFTTDGVQQGRLSGFASELVMPVALAAAPDGSLAIVDRSLRRVLTVSASGNLVLSWGGEGSGYGQFQLPGDVEIDEQGNIYVADFATKKVQKFSPTGVYQASFVLPIDGLPANGTFNAFKLRAGNRLFVNATSNAAIMVGRLSNWVLEAWFPLGSEAASVWDVATTSDIYTVHQTERRIRVYRPMTYTRPIATLVWMSGTFLDSGQSLTLVGSGADSDETPTITYFEWRLNDNQVLGTTPTLTVNNLPAGTHRISFRVRDSEGEWSPPIYQYIASHVKTWTMLLYLAGDYVDRTYQSMEFALNQLADLFSRSTLRNGNVRVVALLDGPANNDTRLFTFEPGRGMTVENRGERAMDDPNTLRQFLLEGQSRFPATYYYVAIANHGQGVTGIGWDYTSDLADDGFANDSAYLSLAELRQALRPGDGFAPITILHLDACSMNTLELAYDLRDQVTYLIAYQYLGWSSFRYDEYAQILNNSVEPRAASAQIVARYAGFHTQRPHTASALDLSRTSRTREALDLLAETLIGLYNDRTHPALQNIRSLSQTFDGDDDNLLNEPTEPYVDLKDWATRLRDAQLNQHVTERANILLSELNDLIITNRYGSPAESEVRLEHTNGVSIVYPFAASPLLNSYVNDRLFTFTRGTKWAQFLRGLDPLSPNQPPHTDDRPIMGPSTLLELPVHRVYTPLILR